VIERLPEPFQSRLGRLAAEVAIGRRATATELAPEAVVDVAALDPNETWREADPVVLAMLATLGIPIPDAQRTYECPGRSQAEHHWRARDVTGDQRRQRCGDVTG
jgi:hypothetical protein